MSRESAPTGRCRAGGSARRCCERVVSRVGRRKTATAPVVRLRGRRRRRVPAPQRCGRSSRCAASRTARGCPHHLRDLTPTVFRPRLKPAICARRRDGQPVLRRWTRPHLRRRARAGARLRRPPGPDPGALAGRHLTRRPFTASTPGPSGATLSRVRAPPETGDKSAEASAPVLVGATVGTPP